MPYIPQGEPGIPAFGGGRFAPDDPLMKMPEEASGWCKKTKA